MAINVDSITKKLAKLGVIEEKLSNLKSERDQLVQDIQTQFGGIGSSLPAAKAASGSLKKGNGKPKAGGLGVKITAYLAANPGKDLQQIAKALKIAPNQVGLGLFHLQKKGLVAGQGGGGYFATSGESQVGKEAATKSPFGLSEEDSTEV